MAPQAFTLLHMDAVDEWPPWVEDRFPDLTTMSGFDICDRTKPCRLLLYTGKVRSVRLFCRVESWKPSRDVEEELALINKVWESTLSHLRPNYDGAYTLMLDAFPSRMYSKLTFLLVDW